MSISIVENRDCMEAMKEFPDKYFELAIVDPPYGFGVNMNMGRRKGKAKKHEDKDWDDSIPNDDYFDELFRVSENQIIWGGNYFGLPANKCFIIWDKAEGIYGRDFAEAEYAWASFNESSRIWKHGPNQIDRIHPTQKPIKLYKWILHNYAKPGDKILDTHLGSGSSRIAAYDMGFDFWGYELDKDYFDAQEKRFKQHTSQIKMFQP
jgi:site-specific DNA-methyltransferase (adenine-specific)